MENASQREFNRTIKPDKIIIDTKDEWGCRRRYSINENGKIHGKYFSWYDNGNKWVEADHMNGEIYGKYISWHENGNKWEEIDYVNDKIHGKYFLWESNGKMTLEKNYINEIEQGKGSM